MNHVLNISSLPRPEVFVVSLPLLPSLPLLSGLLPPASPLIVLVSLLLSVLSTKFGFGAAVPSSCGRIFEEVMDYRTYCETMAGLLQKPIVKLLRNLKVGRNVKWIYQEGISISGRCSLACFNGKLQ